MLHSPQQLPNSLRLPLSPSLSDRIVQPLAAVVANARAALNWLSSDNLNISQANAALEGAARAGMSAGNIVHEMRQLFDRHWPNPRAIDLNTLIEQVISLQAPDVRDRGVAIDCELNSDLPGCLRRRSPDSAGAVQFVSKRLRSHVST